MWYCKFISPFLSKQWPEADTGVHTDPSHFRDLSDGRFCQILKGAVFVNIGSGIPILTLLALINYSLGPHGPCTVVWGLKICSKFKKFALWLCRYCHCYAHSAKLARTNNLYHVYYTLRSYFYNDMYLLLPQSFWRLVFKLPSAVCKKKLSWPFIRSKGIDMYTLLRKKCTKKPT